MVLAEDANPDNLVNFALELDEVANKGTGLEGSSWKSRLEETVAPAIVQEMAVRRMQMVFRAKRSVNAVRFARMVSTVGTSPTEKPGDGGTTNIASDATAEDCNLNRGDMPAAG